MKRLEWRSWGITGRLVTVAVVPATIMFVVISFALYFSGRDEIRSDIQERGSLLAAALAESSQYAVVSGNTAPLNDTFRELLQVDPSVISIEIVGTDQQALVSVGDTKTPLVERQTFHRPIRAQVPDVDLFDKAGGPHVSSSTAQATPFRPGETVGYVRVTMSALPLLEAKRERVYVSLAVVLLTALFSGVAGLYLSQRLRHPLRAVMTALRGIREGNYDVRLKPIETGELGELQATIVEMAKGLSATRQDLEDQVTIRTSALQQAIEAANQADDERRRLIAQGNALVEEERRRIASEIHDDLNASLIVLQLEAQRIASLAAKGGDNQAREIGEIAQRISGTTADLYSAARRIVKQLRPEVIDTLGLKGALQEMVRNYDVAHANCRFSFEAETRFPNLNPQITIAAYRVTQEALSNVVKHANASHATVSLRATSGRIYISIEDNGKGFNAETRTASGIGIIGMRERVAGARGSIKFESSSGSGTRINIELPTDS